MSLIKSSNHVRNSIKVGDWIQVSSGDSGYVNAVGYSDNIDFDEQYYISYESDIMHTHFIIFDSDYKKILTWIPFTVKVTSHINKMCKL